MRKVAALPALARSVGLGWRSRHAPEQRLEADHHPAQELAAADANRIANAETKQTVRPDEATARALNPTAWQPVPLLIRPVSALKRRERVLQARWSLPHRFDQRRARPN
jgi:hypothetical protein